MDDGSYEVTYSIPEVGVYEMHVTIEGQGSISGSPFTLTIGAETEEQARLLKLHPRYFTTEGEGNKKACRHLLLFTVEDLVPLH